MTAPIPPTVQPAGATVMVSPPGTQDLGPDPRLFFIDGDGVGWPHVVGVDKITLTEPHALPSKVLGVGTVIGEGGVTAADGTHIAQGTVLAKAVTLAPEILPVGTKVVSWGTRTKGAHLASAVEHLAHSAEMLKSAASAIKASLARPASQGEAPLDATTSGAAITAAKATAQAALASLTGIGG